MATNSKKKGKKRKRPTNMELALKFRGKQFTNFASTIETMGLQDTIFKMKAEGKTIRNIVAYLNENHPKMDGCKWWDRNVQQFLDKMEKHKDAILAECDDVAAEVEKTAIDTAKGIQKTYKLLNGWIDKADAQGTIWVRCDKCGHGQKVDVFDSDKAIRIAGEIRRTLESAQKLSGSLPDVQVRKTSLNEALNVKRFIDKLVKEGVLIVADQDKLHSYGL